MLAAEHKYNYNENIVRRRERVSKFTVVAVTASIVGFGAAALPGEEDLPGPIPARVVRVVDGDTIVVRARIWLGQEVETSVRIAGIDAPELRGRCPNEKVLANEARLLVESRVADTAVVLRAVAFEKYGGRVMAAVETATGEDLAAILMAAGLARAYAGGARLPWCATAD